MRVIASVSDLSAAALAKTESNSDFFRVVIPGRECNERALMCNCTSENPFLRRVCGVMDSGVSPAGCPGMTKGCLTFESESDRLFSPIARELICWRGAPRAPTSPCASELSDPGQGARMAPSDNLAMEWKPIITAPFDRDLELAIIDYDGTHALTFPCRRFLHGWINAETKKLLDNLRPTHWREW